MTKGLTALALSLVALAAGAGCAVHEAASAPPLTGPSGLSQSVAIAAVPDRLTQDGQSQSAIQVQVFDSTGKPANAIPLRIDMLVGGTLVDFGTLSSRSIVTGSDGRATTVYTAPPAPPPTATSNSNTVTIRAIAVGTNAQTSLSYSADIRLVPPGVILAPGGTPTATFSTSPTVLVANVAANFDASASLAGTGSTGIVSYAWVFGDGTTGSGKTTTHAYATANTYNVTLTVTNDRGIAASTAPTPITVGTAVPPTASFNLSPFAPGVGDSVFFNAAASAAGLGHSIAAYRWTFGDGGTAGGQTTSHPFTAAGTYVVTLTVVDDAGQTATTTQNITVGAPPLPTARFTISPTQPTINEVVVFSGITSTTSQGQSITDYFWNFGDDASCPPVASPGPAACYTQSSSPNITHQYARNGNFTANLVVRDSAGRFGSTALTVPVGAGLPVASITVSPPSPKANVSATFDGSGTTTTGGATVASYTWNFGDGLGNFVSAGPSQPHTFLLTGTYVVRLTVVDSQGRTGTTTVSITVQP